jgi:hypothetical protein
MVWRGTLQLGSTLIVEYRTYLRSAAGRIIQMAEADPVAVFRYGRAGQLAI